MDFLQGKQLLHKGEELILADNIIKKKTVLVLYYFTANNCKPCRSFDLKLKDVYKEVVARKIEISVVIVSTDDDQESMMNNLRENYVDWYAIPFKDELGEILKYNYGVTHIPCLIVVRKNGAVVTRDGKSEIDEIGKNVLVTWL